MVIYADMPTLLSDTEAARFLRVDLVDVHLAMRDGTLATVVERGEPKVVTRRLLIRMGVDPSWAETAARRRHGRTAGGRSA